MASTFSDLKIELIGPGEQAGTWGTTTNTNLGTAVEEAITGSADVTFSGADITLTLTDTNSTQAARNLRLNLVGTSGGARELILGSGCQINKLYLVRNTLADAVTIKNTTGTGVTVPAGSGQFVFNDGTNIVNAIDLAAGDVTLNGTQTLTNKTIAFGSNTLTDVASTNTAQTLTNKTLTSPTLTSPELTGSPYVNGSYRGNIVSMSNNTVDCTAGNYFTRTISANSTFTFSNAPASRSYAFTLELTHTSGTVTWPAAVRWPDNTAPTLTTGKTHLFVFVTDDGGTSWRGGALVDYNN